MKRLAALLVTFAIILCGCASGEHNMDRAMALRARLLQSKGCQFTAVIAADYGKTLYSFELDCEADDKGAVRFKVTQPQSIAGVTGRIDGEGGKLTFDDQAVAFPLLADDQFSPVSAPCILLKTLRGGYMTSCGQQGGTLVLSIDDRYEEDALQLDIFLDGEDLPRGADIYWKGERCLSLEVKNFRIL